MAVWCVKAIYSSGGHFITDKSGNKLRFNSKEEASNLAEVIAAENKKIPDQRFLTSYIVVEEII